ncbi:hypothetical protein [Acidicapsa ligni]|uniref:hypothetical protein n=1 Tax=Acidicapsa ligni TaxID=542300 RepID=UPI0021E0F113|nr:hypothetical protein [Acidicapsa ligni]
MRIPLYVGQTRRLLGRVGDYHSAQFYAPTDFCVGEAIKYLRGEKQCRIDFLYRSSESHRKDEKVLIRELLLAGCTLLNVLSSFDYKSAEKSDERLLVHRFFDMALDRARIAG